jgi:hypothetical protein
MAAIHWLERRRHLDRAIRWLAILPAIMVALLLLGGLVGYALLQAWVAGHADPAVADQVRLVGYLLLLGGMALLLIFPLVWPVLRALRRRIGSDGTRLFLRYGDGRIVTLPPAVAHTRLYLLHGRHSVPLRKRQGGSLYADGELEKWVDPLLRPDALLSQWQGLVHQWKHRDGLLLWPLASAAGMLLLLALTAALQWRYGAGV